jgi:hypothetical protein
MSVPYYYWKTPEDAAFLLLLLALLGLIQTGLSNAAAYTLYIASPIVLTLVPLGVVLAQAAAAAVLAGTLAPSLLPSQRPGVPAPSPSTRGYLRRFILVLLSAGVVLIIWGAVYALTFIATPFNQPSLLVKYILANAGGALGALAFSVVAGWLLKR